MTRAASVWLNDTRVGTLTHAPNGAHTFRFESSYLDLPAAPTLGQAFLDQPGKGVTAMRRLPPWFSNLLPEGALRTVLALAEDVNPTREWELLLRAGEDLPGAVRVLPTDEDPGTTDDLPPVAPPEDRPDELKFSLAGVQIKFSVAHDGERFVLPAHGRGGDWIVKLPDGRFPGVPRVEYSMMTLARHAGLDVPAVELVEIESVVGLPPTPTGTEREAFAIRRYDRREGARIHQEDFAQVLGVWPGPTDKYRTANYETVANIVRRVAGDADYLAMVQRLVFSILIGNGDAHLKNWSLIYPDGVRARLSPAYDLVSTVVWLPGDRLALNLSRSKDFAAVDLAAFRRLARKAGADEDATEGVVVHTVRATRRAWSQLDLPLPSEHRRRIDEHVAALPLSRL